jgi:hypothetical protein
MAPCAVEYLANFSSVTVEPSAARTMVHEIDNASAKSSAGSVRKSAEPIESFSQSCCLRGAAAGLFLRHENRCRGQEQEIKSNLPRLSSVLVMFALVDEGEAKIAGRRPVPISSKSTMSPKARRK